MGQLIKIILYFLSKCRKMGLNSLQVDVGKISNENYPENYEFAIFGLLKYKCNYSKYIIFVSNNKYMAKKITAKYSKISTILRYQFLKMILREGSTVKQAAKKFGINYSTAKSIARENNNIFSDDDWDEQPIVDTKEMKRAQYRCIIQGKEKIEFNTNSTHKNEECVQPTTTRPLKITIVSRVDWQYQDYKQKS